MLAVYAIVLGLSISTMIAGLVKAVGIADIDIPMGPISSIYEISDSAGRRVVTIELNGSVTIAEGLTASDAAEITYAQSPFRDECTKDYTYTYEFDFIDNDHSGIGNWTVGLQPSGGVVYVGITPTPLADTYSHKLADLAGQGACNSRP